MPALLPGSVSIVGGKDDAVLGTLVCAVDDSAEARAALRVATRLARSLDATLVVAHEVEPLHPPGASAAPGAPVRLRRKERDKAEVLVERLAREEGAPEEAELHVEVGGAVESVRDLAAQRDRPLLVVGSRGRGAARSALLGSTSTALAAQAACPVLVVPAAAGSDVG